MTKKIIRFIIGLGVLSLMIYAIITYKGSTYSSDGSMNEAISDKVENDGLYNEYKKTKSDTIKKAKK